MECYLASLCVFVAAALGLGLVAVAASFRPPRPRRSRRVNALGAGCAALGCAVGFAGVIEALLKGGATVELLWGLPVGHLVLRLDALSAFFLLPVFGLGFVCALSGGIALRSARPGEHNLAAHWFFFLLLLMGMACVMCAADAIFLLLACEIISLEPFFLIDF
ncbi:MAG: hypothetical protein K2G99_01605, partial [Desulfovibrio sp.]|nr:hypothetical protein [Desulfovibrio sp.]